MVVNSKRRKKALDNYIKKKLKREECERLFKALSGSSFKSELLISSKALGQKESRKEKEMKRDLLEKSKQYDSNLGNQNETRTKLSRVRKEIKAETRVSVRDDSENDSASEASTVGELIEEDTESFGEEQQHQPTFTPGGKEEVDSQEIQSHAQKPELIMTVSSTHEVKKVVTSVHPNDYIPSYNVPVHRSEEVTLGRLQLPILQYESEILDSIGANPVSIICGETGSGKTTQLPQFLYEIGYGDPHHPLIERRGRVIITQPRRMATISSSRRVAYELGLSEDSRIGYQIRHESSINKKERENNRILFVTDGILLRLIQSDFLLKDTSLIVIDEAHERNVNSDILIGLLSRIVQLRNKLFDEEQNIKDKKGITKLKLVIMSATLKISDFVENNKLFPGEKPPVVNIPGRQFPVTTHYTKRTPRDYLKAAYNKVVQIHKKLPLGNILVFVTGQGEVKQLVKKLRDRFHDDHHHYPNIDKTLDVGKPVQQGRTSDDDGDDDGDDDMDIFDVDKVEGDLDAQEGEDLKTNSEDSGSDKDAENKEALEAPLIVLPLYSLLPIEEQLSIFQQTQSTHVRVCIVSTNVAETSVTLPNVRYVVDTGKVKNRLYSDYVERYEVGWVSKASADQRSGRAGRIGPGHTYRLYSAALYHELFEDYKKPEILTLPMENVVLLMKSIGVDGVAGFPFPTPPEPEAILKAEKKLLLLEALELKKIKGERTFGTVITPLGKKMSVFPLTPRLSKMIVLGGNFSDCLLYVINLVAALAIPDPFISDSENGCKALKVFSVGGDLDSDIIRLLSVFGAFEYESPSNKTTFCRDFNLRYKAMNDMLLLKEQLIGTLKRHFCTGVPMTKERLLPPTSEQIQVLMQIYLAAYCDHVARLSDSPFISHSNHKIHTYETLSEDKYHALGVPIDEWFKLRSGVQKAQDSDEITITVIYKQSVMAHQHYSQLPKWIVYEKLESFEVSNDLYATSKVKKICMKNCSVIRNEAWIPKWASNICAFSRPLETPCPFYDRELDTIVCYSLPKIADHWILSPAMISFPSSLQRQLSLYTLPNEQSNSKMKIEGLQFKYFAKFLLDGLVFTTLSKYTDKLNSPSAIMLKPYALNKIVALSSALSKYNIDSRKKLETIWYGEDGKGGDKKFLLNEYFLWIAPDAHNEISKHWPPKD